MSVPPTQKEILAWAASTFGDVALNTGERAFRFIEEALELFQSCGMSREQAASVLDRVYSRPRDASVHKETGQTAMTLLALAEWLGIDVDDALLGEWRRVQSIPHEEWVRRHNAKAEMGIAAPMAPQEGK